MPDSLDEPGPEAPTGTGEHPGARFGRVALRRYLAGGHKSGQLHAGRTALAGATAFAAVLLVATFILHQAGGWPFAREDTAAPRSTAEAAQPRPPTAGGPTTSPSDRESDEGDGSPRASKPAAKDDGSGKGSGEDRGKRGKSALPARPDIPASGGGSGGETGSPGCNASWHVESQWEDFTASIRVTNNSGQPLRGWQVDWTWLGGDQRLSKTWNADIRQSGNSVTARNVSNNAEIPTTGEATFGFEATGSGSPAPHLTCRVL